MMSVGVNAALHDSFVSSIKYSAFFHDACVNCVACCAKTRVSTFRDSYVCSYVAVLFAGLGPAKFPSINREPRELVAIELVRPGPHEIRGQPVIRRVARVFHVLATRYLPWPAKGQQS